MSVNLVSNEVIFKGSFIIKLLAATPVTYSVSGHTCESHISIQNREGLHVHVCLVFVCSLSTGA